MSSVGLVIQNDIMSFLNLREGNNFFKNEKNSFEKFLKDWLDIVSDMQKFI